MSSSMQAYLAAKYMSGPKADAILAKTSDKPKKKKRKVATDASTSTTSFIRDDDGGWGREARDSDEEEMKDVQTGSDRTFKKKTKSNWEVVQPGEGIPEEEPRPKDEEPLVVETDEQPVFRAGLMTADQLRKAAPKKKKPTKEEMDEAAAAAAQETVYRDSSGRKIDTKAERAEAARKRREQEELEARKMEWGKGLVQREEEERRRLELEKEKTRGMARYADDADLNADQKAQDRWNDPAAAFLTTKKSKGPKKPEYKGPPPPPNRFGIKPGYRWDGVDRGNGFEKKFFQKQNERARRGAEAYEYSVDDMTNEPLSREEFVLTLGNAALGIALAFLNHHAPWRMEDVQLDTTQLLFVPGPAEHDAPTVVQVTLTSDTNPTSSETLARYHLVQSELTKLILLILIHHKSKPLPTPTKVHGEGFSLIASHRPWVYGQQWAFKWGKENILPAEDKWTFEFRAR